MKKIRKKEKIKKFEEIWNPIHNSSINISSARKEWEDAIQWAQKFIEKLRKKKEK